MEKAKGKYQGQKTCRPFRVVHILNTMQISMMVWHTFISQENSKGNRSAGIYSKQNQIWNNEHSSSASKVTILFRRNQLIPQYGIVAFVNRGILQLLTLGTKSGKIGFLTMFDQKRQAFGPRKGRVKMT